MSGNIGGPPEPFALSPLLALLPDVGDVGRLESLTPSLYARQEKVEASRAESNDKELERRYAAEGAMLRQILEWLTDKSGGAE
jgi:hypothetical protein